MFSADEKFENHDNQMGSLETNGMEMIIIAKITRPQYILSTILLDNCNWTVINLIFLARVIITIMHSFASINIYPSALDIRTVPSALLNIFIMLYTPAYCHWLRKLNFVCKHRCLPGVY